MLRDGLRHLLRSARGFSPDTRRFLWGMGLMGIGFGAMQVHLNLFLAGLGWSESAIGGTLAAWSLGLVVVALPAAAWVERRRPGRIFAFTAVGFSLCLVLMVRFPLPWVVLLLSFLAGTLFAVHWVAEAPFFARTEESASRTELFGLAAALEALAMVVAAWGTGALTRLLSRRLGSDTAGLGWALVVAALCSLLAAAPYSRIAMLPLPAHSRNWRDRLRSPEMGLILRLTAPAFLIGFGAGLTVPFLNLYFRDRFGQGPASVGFYFSVAHVLTMAGFVLGPMLARRFGHVRAVIATQILAVPFFLVLAVTDRLWVAVGAFWMRGALMNMNQPVSQAFAADLVSPGEQAVANAVRTFAWNGSWMLSAVLGGWLIEHHGYLPGMLSTMGLYLAAAALFWRWFGPARGGGLRREGVHDVGGEPAKGLDAGGAQALADAGHE